MWRCHPDIHAEQTEARPCNFCFGPAKLTAAVYCLHKSLILECCSFAGSGLIAFALTVALVQQSVRGAIEANVKTGGTLFEIDHVRAHISIRMPVS